MKTIKGAENTLKRLRVGTVLLDRHGKAWQKTSTKGWMEPGSTLETKHFMMFGPFTILHEPDPEPVAEEPEQTYYWLAPRDPLPPLPEDASEKARRRRRRKNRQAREFEEYRQHAEASLGIKCPACRAGIGIWCGANRLDGGTMHERRWKAGREALEVTKQAQQEVPVP
ncbi:hypothetical protein [Aeromicrobium sp. 179-A 4D2 NHS]|uniref:hypothetical protein n=1 Tax=Aeromicrobium sp. 179-A 4D2 NHS TaxID=3142375 RepID=UPI0039A38A29